MPLFADNTKDQPAHKTGLETRHDWRCAHCFALLGKRGDQNRVHLKTTRGVEYFATLPATATCRCGRLNELQPARRRG